MYILTDYYGNNSTGWTYGQSLLLSDNNADVSAIFIKFCTTLSPKVMCSKFQSLQILRRGKEYKLGICVFNVPVKKGHHTLIQKRHYRRRLLWKASDLITKSFSVIALLSPKN